MSKRSKLLIVLSVLILSLWVLALAVEPVFAKFRGGGMRSSSSSVRSSVSPSGSASTTKSIASGAAGGAVGAAAARAVMRGQGGPGDAQAGSKEVYKDVDPSVTIGAATKASEESLLFNYDPKGKPDPFKPFVDAELALRKLKEAELKKKQQKLPLSPLQRVGIEQFKLVGIGGNERGRTAVVQDTSGKYYTLSVGTPIGMNNGKVARINGDRVVIEEPTAGSKKGKTGAKKVEIKLLKESEEVKP
jgi:type IV pilus assembly protein PilP